MNGAHIEKLENAVMHVAGQPAGSFIELGERLVLYTMMSGVACCGIIVDGVTAIATMLLRCAAVALIGLGIAAFLTGAMSFQPWAASQFPREHLGPARPRIEVDSIRNGRQQPEGSRVRARRAAEDLVRAEP
jgi:hypothetical protein